MTNLNEYLQDGAGYQAKATLAVLQNRISGGGIEASWSDKFKRYTATPQVGRWENCREQGYVVSLRGRENQLNIAFFEHRISDTLCAIKWNQFTTNTPNIENAKFEESGGYRLAHSVDPGAFVEMAEWIKRELEAFYMADNKID